MDSDDELLSINEDNANLRALLKSKDQKIDELQFENYQQFLELKKLTELLRRPGGMNA